MKGLFSCKNDFTLGFVKNVWAIHGVSAFAVANAILYSVGNHYSSS